MDISVLICTWNNCKRLAVTLDSLIRCRIPQGLSWELILVNNNCSDETDTVVAQFQSRLPLKYLKESRQGLSVASNTAILQAAGRLLIFTDDDVEFFPEWMMAYWKAYQARPKGFYFGGPIESNFENDQFDRDLLTVAPESVKGLDLGDEEKALPQKRYLLGANWACPAEALKEVGGFDMNAGLNPSLKRIRTGSETIVMQRLNQKGWQGYYLPEARIKHFVKARACELKFLAIRREAWGHYQARYYKEYMGGRMFLGCPRWMYRVLLSNWVKWIIKRVKGEKGYLEYVAFREIVGLIQGTREINQAERVNGA